MTTIKSMMQDNMADDLARQRRINSMSFSNQLKQDFIDYGEDLVIKPFIPGIQSGPKPSMS